MNGNTPRHVPGRAEPSLENLARDRQREWLRCARLRQPADVRHLEIKLKTAYERKRVAR
jgi:hypothetical protein